MYVKMHQQGFTLIELAVVMIIIGVLLGGFINTLSSRIEQSQRAETREQLEDIKAALSGFATANGFLPCPATALSAGGESRTGSSCSQLNGFVPAKTLGLNGRYNSDNLLLDSWGNPFRYSVTGANSGAFTKLGQIKATGMNSLAPNLIICNGNSSSATGCSGGATKLTDNAVFVVLSLGKDGSHFVGTPAPDSDEGENAGEATVSANTAGENLAYTVGNNRVFVSRSYRSANTTAGLFDDLIIWMSPYVFYSQMIAAGQLP